jgi:hypothetical protein
MNFSAFDLDIDNYEISDLETFFHLDTQGKYTFTELDEKTVTLKTNLQNKVSDKNFMKKMLSFIDVAKDVLLDNLKTNQIIVAGPTFLMDQRPESTINSVTNFIQPINTFPTDTAPGILNRLRRRTNFISLAFNTFFRDEVSVSSTDCFFSLPYPLKNVVSMKLSSLELPETIYLLSNDNYTNQVFIKEHGTNIQGVVVVPEGCYSSTTISSAVESSINTQLGTGTRFSVTVDPANGKTTITNSVNVFDVNFITHTQHTTYNNRNLGWILGYRSATYAGLTTYKSEGVFNGTPLDYVYFVLNDYQLSNSTNLIAIFKDSYIEKHIIAKIPYSNTNFQTLFENSERLISPRRSYYGPVDISKMSIRLLDKYGQLVDLHNMDYSFTLEAEVVYESLASSFSTR